MAKVTFQIPHLTETEKRVIDALFIANQNQLDFLKEEKHHVRKKRPLEQGWLIMKDLRRMIGDRKYASKIHCFSRINLGNDHEKLNFYKLPETLKSLEKKGLVDREYTHYKDRKKRDSHLYAYRLSITRKAWHILARLYFVEQGFPYFYLSDYSIRNKREIMPLANDFRKIVSEYEGIVINPDNLPEKFRKEWIENREPSLDINAPLLHPRLFELYLIDSELLREELAELAALRKIPGVDWTHLSRIIFLGEKFYAKHYEAIGYDLESNKYMGFFELLWDLRKEKLITPEQEKKITKYLRDHQAKAPFTKRVRKATDFSKDFRTVAQEANLWRKQKSEVKGERKKTGGS